MYVCFACGAVSKPGDPLIRHVLYFYWVDEKGCERKDIEREIPVCAECKRLLATLTIKEVQERLQIQYANRTGLAAQPPAPPRKRSNSDWLSRAVPIRGQARRKS